jgi:protein gp37
MGADSPIEWTTHTFNPWTGCAKVSEGCRHCYAEAWAKRFGLVQWGPGAERRRTSAATWRQPLRWHAEAVRTGTRPRVFCASLADVFDAAAPDAWRADLWALIAATPALDWLLLTKRVHLVPASVPPTWLAGGWPSHVWLGVTVTGQAEAERDVPRLLDLPAPVRFLSCEPLLAPLDLRAVHYTSGYGCSPCSSCGAAVYIDALTGSSWCKHGCDGPCWPALDWVIAGGESGPRARPMHPDWVRSLRDQCVAAGVAFHFKQWGEWAPGRPGDRTTDGLWMHMNGDTFSPVSGEPFNPAPLSTHVVRRGKRRAGRALDGRTHDELPPSPAAARTAAPGEAAVLHRQDRRGNAS